MTSPPGYDFVIQLHREVVCDVQTRAINASLLTNLAVASPISRVIAQVIPPFQMKAHWDKPDLDFAGELLRLSANVRGGTRHVTKGINLTVEGTIGAACRPIVTASRDGQPVVALTAPSPLDLDLADLDLSYEGDDEPLSWVDTTIEQTVLRPSFSLLLMAPLASLPLSYLPDSLPLHLKATHTKVATEDLVLADSTVSLNPQAASLTLAMCCTVRTPAPAKPANLLQRPTTANAAVAVSETGLNQVLGWLCARGLAAGIAQLGEGPIHWRWTHVAVTFTKDDNVRLTGQLWHGATAVEVDAAVQCSLTASGQLSLRLTSPMPRPSEAALLIEATATLIRRIFSATLSPPRPASATQPTRGSAEKLLQRFLAPDTNISVEAPAVELALRHGYLVALYEIPLNEQPITLTIEEATPKPTIDQLVIPSQMAPGAPVTALLNATLANHIEPPYDYAWRVDHESRPRVDHGSKLILTKTPSSVGAPLTAATGPQKLATVNLKVIDILGQVGEVEVDATYYPAPTSLEQPQHEKEKAVSKKGGGGTFLLIITVLVVIFYKNLSERPAGQGGPTSNPLTEATSQYINEADAACERWTSQAALDPNPGNPGPLRDEIAWAQRQNNLRNNMLNAWISVSVPHHIYDRVNSIIQEHWRALNAHYRVVNIVRSNGSQVEIDQAIANYESLNSVASQHAYDFGFKHCSDEWVVYP